MNIPFERVNEPDFIEVPGSQPQVQAELQQVGISNRPHYINVLDPFSGEPTRLWVQVKLSLNLPADQRGLHMSRIERQLHEIEKEPVKPLGDFVKAIVQKIIDTQPQNTVKVEIIADYELAVDKNPSGKPSHELLKLMATAESRGGEIRLQTGMSAPFMNACPCAQRWGIRDFAAKLAAKNYTPEQIQDIIVDAPLQGHTQRGDAKLHVHAALDHALLYAILEKSSPLVRELLAGSDEGAVVRQAQELGMFVEDVAREVMLHAAQDLAGKIGDDVLVEIDVEADESVHHHNLFVKHHDTFANLRREVGAGAV